MDNNTAHFVRLAAALNTPFRLQEPLPVTIEALSATLCCTSRNVKFIIRKLEEKAWIGWQPGRGRGHTSRLTFLRSVDEVLEGSLQELMAKGKIKQAIELIGMAGQQEPLQERMIMAVNKQMGFHSESETSSGQDVLRMMRNRRLEQLDPAVVYTAFESYLLGQICSTLVTYDASTESFQPALAHMWECNEDHTRWVFYLRKGVRFHHGRVMTSRDVKETLQRIFELQSPASCLYEDIERVELAGDHCIRFDLCRPNLFFLHLFSCTHMSILPYDVDSSVEMIGTGPYRIKELSEDMLVLTAFDHYYGIRPLLDRVDIWFVPEQGTNERQYELPGIDPMKGSPEPYGNNRIDYPALGCRYMLFNLRKEGVQHKLEFRQALRILYNQMALITELGGNRITPANSFLPWNSSQRTWEEPSLEQAAELLRVSGYAGEVITLAFMDKKGEREEAEWLQKRCASLGLTIKLNPVSHFDPANIRTHAELLIAEEVLDDDWQWDLIHYFKNRSNYLHALLGESELSRLEAELAEFSRLPSEGRAMLLDRAEALLRDNCWLMHGCHMNKGAQLNQSLFGLHAGSFGFLDISKLWIKTGFQ